MAQYAWIISVIGNAITLVGAFLTARAVILTKQQADAISSVPYGGQHPRYADALMAQSKAAEHGLYLVVIGTALQILRVHRTSLLVLSAGTSPSMAMDAGDGVGRERGVQ